MTVAVCEVRRIGRRTWEADSRSRNGLKHVIRLAIDGVLICTCEAGSFKQRECWAVQEVRKEIESMNETESREIVPVNLTRREALLPTERDYQLIEKAAAMVMAGAVSLPKELNTKEKVGAVMLYGLELGLAPMSALRHLYIVNGKVQPSTEVMAGLLLSRYKDARLKVDELTNERCVMRLVWPSRDVNDTYIVTMEDLKRAGLADGEVAKKYPQDRLRYHATKRLLRIYAPDVINGMDQGAPIVDESAGQNADDIDESELWNPGDAHVIDGESRLIDEDGVVESVAMVTDDQIRAITDWSEGIRADRSEDALKACVTWAKGRFLYAVEGTKFRSSLLTETDATVFIDVLRACCQEGAMPAAQTAMV